MSRPILLFGSAGQVGRNLTALATACNVGLQGVTREEADLTAAEVVAALVESTRPRLIINAAAYTAVDRAEQEPELADAVNALGAQNVARAAAAAKVPILHLSTDYVFNGSKSGAYVESDALAPLNVYGRTKARGEALVQAASPLALILRTGWVFGPYGKNFLKNILQLAVTEARLRVVADQHGCPTCTADIAEAILAVDRAVASGQWVGGIFHFAGRETISWHSFAQAIVEYQAKDTQKFPIVDAIETAAYPTLARRPPNSTLDSGLFARTFGYCAKPWSERMRESIDFLLRNNSTLQNAGEG